MIKVNGISEITNIWDQILSIISTQVDKISFDAFFKDTKIDGIEGDTIYVICKQQFLKSLFEQKYYKLFSDAAEQATQTNYKIVFRLEGEQVTNVVKNDLSTSWSFFRTNIIDPSLNFENFVVGPSNNEAQKASIMVATNPGTLYQTLFIYGNSGLGKTHLLNAIGNYIKETIPEKRVLLCSSQDFINEYLDFVNGTNRKEQLITFLKQFDIFLIDDIQMLRDKKKTQEFFFNIYEDFRQNHKQVVFTSDKLPGELDGIDARLITRFTSGLSVPLYKPDVKTCVEILKKKITRGGYDINSYDEDVIYFIADKFKDSIRSLEGALVRLNFYASFNKISHIDIDLCVEALQGMVDCSDAKETVTEQKILNSIASYYNLSISQITGKIKTSNIAFARHIAIYLIRDMLNLSFKKIGDLFSKRDHSTIMHSVEKVEKMLKDDPQVQTVVKELKKRIES